VAAAGAAAGTAAAAGRSRRAAHGLAALALADKAAGGHHPADLGGAAGRACLGLAFPDHEVFKVVIASGTLVFVDRHKIRPFGCARFPVAATAMGFCRIPNLNIGTPGSSEFVAGRIFLALPHAGL